MKTNRAKIKVDDNIKEILIKFIRENKKEEFNNLIESTFMIPTLDDEFGKIFSGDRFVIIEDLELPDYNFTDYNFTGVIFKRCRFSFCLFHYVEARNTSFCGCSFLNCDVSKMRMDSEDLIRDLKVRGAFIGVSNTHGKFESL